ncbi:MAG: peptidase S8, partial [Candidatus Eremiobacteraeota bacterium]|nr:peptidase S8 [Candidatus Eremiobacteraeota bacterium]
MMTTNAVTPNSNGPYGPADLHAAYKLSTTAGAGQKIAIVDAFNDPTAESDLAHYRAHFGLSPCTTANGCFKKVNQNGVQGSYPKTDGGWASEISLDLDMVSAICSHCKILLIEAANNSSSSLAIGVNRAVAMGANVVSNSYGGAETASSDSAYNHPGHIITASAGDNGTAAQQPCSLSTVVCVGGTSLMRSTNARKFTETVWSGTGSGCSAVVAKPAWQTDRSGVHCGRRSEADVSAVADPNTGVIVYDSTPIPNPPGPALTCSQPDCFWIFGGTSASSPIAAVAYGLAANAGSQTYAKSIWTHPGSFFDV